MAQSNTKIDPKQVKWDEAPQIDASKVQWDEPKKKSSAEAVLEGANAFGTGGNRGYLRLLGLPVDTVVNVTDLLKAGAGTAYGAITGNAPPTALDPMNRKSVVGTGDWLIEQARKNAVTKAAVDPSNPEYEGGYLQTIGGGLTNVANPASKTQLVNQLLLGTGGSVAGKAVRDLTGNEALAIVASMTPLAAQNIAVGATKRAIRGKDGAGDVAMRQRIQDLRNAGVDEPTLGLASGNSSIGGVENLLQQTPGAVNIMRNAREKALAGMQSRVMDAAEAASPNRGSLESGVAIQSGIKGKRDQFKDTQRSLYDRLDQHVPPNTPSDVGETVKTLALLNQDIPGAPNTSKLFKNSRIAGIEQAINADLTQPQAYTPSQLRAAAMTQPDGPIGLSTALGEGRLPYEAVKKTRTLVGNEIADSSLMSDVPRSKWNPLYAALSEDLRSIADKSGPEATAAFNRANQHTRAGMQRLDRVAPFSDVTAPEQAFTNLQRTLGENVSSFQAVKKSLPEGARGQIAGTVIERLGRATNGVQNDLGDVWSPETFLTNWNKMSDKGRHELFSGFKNSDQVRQDVEAVAKATSMMRDSSKLWSNPSGSGANLFARGVFAAGAGSALLNPWAPVAAGTTVGGANLLSRALTSPRVVNAAAQPNTITPQMRQGLMQLLLSADRGAYEQEGKPAGPAKN